MVKYWECLGEYDAEGTTYTALAGGAGSSPYTPKENARLIGLRVIVGSDAATSLTEIVQFKLTCTTFKPNAIECGGNGSGLRTAPAFQLMPIDWEVDQEVRAGVPITIEARDVTADTPVTNSVTLWGLFES